MSAARERVEMAAVARTVRATAGRTIAVGEAATDCAFLAIVTVVSLVPYVGRLGFYYDDYSVLSRMGALHDRSLLGLYHAVRPLTGQRPLQALTFATLYRVFGLHPLGYHVVNACLLVAVGVLLYFVLHELRLPRLLCVSLPLLYLTLPHYATNRFWLDAFQITLSTAFYFASLYAGLRALRARPAARLAWLAVAVLGVAGSLLAYEVIYPLFLLNLGLIWWSARRPADPNVERATARITIGVLAAAVVAVGVAKTALVAEHGQNGYQIGFGGGFVRHAAWLAFGAVRLNLGSYLLAIPYVLWWIVQHRLSGANAAAAVASGLLALAYLWHLGRREKESLAKSSTWRASMLIGLVAFALGYAIFLTNQNILFRSAGIDNRVNAAAALGVAGMLVGALGWLAGRLGERRRTAFFATTTAAGVAAGVFIVTALGSFWTSASGRQQALVSGLRLVAPTLPASSTVILDGACPEIGPAVVFADQWDFRGAIQLGYHEPSLTGDVASETLRAGPRRLALEMTFLGHVSTRTYPYGRKLLVYDSASRRLYRLQDQGDATRYLTQARPSFHCSPQRSFAWGLDPTPRLSLP